MSDEKNRDILTSYLPEKAVDVVLEWIKSKNVHLKITKNRKTKLGDYRAPVRYKNHRITVNHDLNPYAFLITFVHEYAHLLVYEQFKNRVKPHGKEWKATYRMLIHTFLEMDIFPDDLKQVLEQSVYKSKASSHSDLKLSRVLHKYDKVTGVIRIEDLPENAVFRTETGRLFRKGPRQRIRYKCQNLDNRRYYLFHPLTPVIPEDTSE
jgi:hypothetical protein